MTDVSQQRMLSVSPTGTAVASTLAMSDEVRKQLVRLTIDHGRNVCRDRKRCEALFRDYCSDSNRGSVKTLLLALDEGVATVLLASTGQEPTQVVLGRLSARLERNCGMNRQVAGWVVETWAVALGVMTATPMSNSQAHTDSETLSPTTSSSAASTLFETKEALTFVPTSVPASRKTIVVAAAAGAITGVIGAAILIGASLWFATFSRRPHLPAAGISAPQPARVLASTSDSKEVVTLATSPPPVEIPKASTEEKKTETSRSVNPTAISADNPSSLAISKEGTEKSKEADKQFESKTTGMKFTLIPAGSFQMGSPASETERDKNESPQHTIKITRPFFMGIHEVTQHEYEKVIGKNPSAFSKNGLKSSKIAGANTGTFPVESITWYEAVEFCNKLGERDGLPAAYVLTEVVRDGASVTNAIVSIGGDGGYRLPTEAEWEYACRGGTTTSFSVGRTLSNQDANVAVDPKNRQLTWRNPERTVRVDSFLSRQNRFGLYNMHGNVREWCWDGYDKNSYTSRDTTTSDPIVEGKASRRALRGGSWVFYSKFARSAYRTWYDPKYRSDDLGFRVVVGRQGVENR